MDKIKVTEDMVDVIKEWFKYASEQSVESLPKFINHLLNDYQHDYGTICHAISACAFATANACAIREGITGFQASCVMWDFIRQWAYPTNMSGLKIINYDDMLYPQYESKFDKVIDRDVWNSLQAVAKQILEKEKDLYPEVKAHMESIVSGVVPFGYRVKD